MSNKILCGNASDSIYLTYKGGCRKDLNIEDCYRCTGCGGRFHKDCILEHFKLEEKHDWGRQEERQALSYEIEVLKKKLDEKQADYMGVNTQFTVNADAIKTPEEFVKAITMWGFHRGNWQNFINDEELTPWIEMARAMPTTNDKEE